MKSLGLVVAILVLPPVPAAFAQEEVKESTSVKLADIVGRWTGTWPNAAVYGKGKTVPTYGFADTITIDSTGTGTTHLRLGCGNGLCVNKPVVVGDTLVLGVIPAAATASGKDERWGYVIALKDQQLTLTNITEKTSVFIGKRIDVSTPKP